MLTMFTLEHEQGEHGDYDNGVWWGLLACKT
jgi:hypothetical protein